MLCAANDWLLADKVYLDYLIIWVITFINDGHFIPVECAFCFVWKKIKNKKVYEASIVRLYLSLKVTFITRTRSFLCWFCIQAEIILQGTMYLSPDVGSGAPPGLAWGPSATIQDRVSLVAALLAYLGGKQATVVHWQNAWMLQNFPHALIIIHGFCNITSKTLVLYLSFFFCHKYRKCVALARCV